MLAAEAGGDASLRRQPAEPAAPQSKTGSGATDPARGREPEPVPRARVESLPVAEFLDAVVSLPAKAGRQPVWFASHGAGGAPEPHCSAWRQLLGEQGIIVCLRGSMIDRRYGAAAGFYYPNHFELEKELIATLTSFETAYAELRHAERYVYAGYSQGATMGALILPKHAATFPRAVLIEGGFNEWGGAAAKTFKHNGGQQIAFVCGVKACQRGAERSVGTLKRAEVDAKSSYAPGAGHTYLGVVARETAALLPWLLEGDERWSKTLFGSLP